MLQDLDDGYIVGSAILNIPDIIISTNYNFKAGWSIYVNSADIFFSPNVNEKKASDLFWKLSTDPESKYRPITEYQDLVFSGYGSREIEINFKLLISWEDIPTNYSLDLEFNIDEKTNNRIMNSKGKKID